jgi:hypothetical protein
MRRTLRLGCVLSLASFALGGCASSVISSDDAGLDVAEDRVAPAIDGARADGGGGRDARPGPDVSGDDAGETDAGETDAGETDAGETDAATTDAGETDAATTDAGTTDAGRADGGGACEPGRTSCAGSCVDTRTDGMNCGACGTVCARGQVCAAGACACPMGQTLCAGACVDTRADGMNCGACGTVCPMGQSCAAGMCAAAPSNDTRAGATVIPLMAAATTVTTDTTGASNHTTGACGCTMGRDVFYTFTLAREEVVYADTIDGQGWDSSLFLQDAMGTNVASSAGFEACSDDVCGGTRSQIVQRLAPGQYYLVLSGCGAGRATIRFQHLPTGSGALERIRPSTTSQTITGSVAPGMGRVDGGCGSGGPENLYVFTTCGDFTASELHATTCGSAGWDTVLHEQSPGRAMTAVCNDDFCGVQSSLEAMIPAGAGLHGLYVDTYGMVMPGMFSARYRLGGCATDLTDCGGTCRYTAGDAAHCGRCGNACTGGQSCTMGTCGCPAGQTACAGACRALATDSANCGACGTVCPSGASCAASVCVFSTSATDLTVAGTQTINTVAASVSGTSGITNVAISNVVGTFRVGDLVLLHQTQIASAAAGQYEYRRVTAVAAGGLTLDAGLTNTYLTGDVPYARAQIVRVEEARNVTVPAGSVLTAPAWNGSVGGILAIAAAGSITVGGRVSMDGRGFRGRGHACTYRCARGYQGEGHVGQGGTNILANGSGGGGGGAGPEDASGAGGGHAATGANGGTGRCGGGCAEACPVPGGSGGGATGEASLVGRVFFGGAGGEGGADEDGSSPGLGGAGGGAILLRARDLTVSGAISSAGEAGLGGSNACGGAGCGMGGGGGGAGGAIRLQAVTSATVGAGLLRVTGGGGGGGSCGTATGGVGSAGRIGVSAPMVSGSSTPAFDRN